LIAHPKMKELEATPRDGRIQKLVVTFD